jgi:hypothetical protein
VIIIGKYFFSDMLQYKGRNVEYFKINIDHYGKINLAYSFAKIVHGYSAKVRALVGLW